MEKDCTFGDLERVIGDVVDVESVVRLDVSGMRFDEESFECLSKLCGLEVLIAEGCRGVDGVLRLFPGLVELNVCNSDITGVGLRYVEMMVGLERVDLSRCDGIVAGGAFGRLESLLYLNLSGCKMVGWRGIGWCKRLKELSIACTGINDEELCAVAGIQSLRKIDVSGCDTITDVGLGYLVGRDVCHYRVLKYEMGP